MPGGQDAHAAVLTTIGPKANASEGDPVESAVVLFADGATEFGIWEVTPGTFRSSKNGVTELMHFVSGEGTITADDGTVTEVGPGVVLLTPTGGRERGSCARPCARRTRSTRTLRRGKPDLRAGEGGVAARPGRQATDPR